jgi:hypothetical protein
MTRLRTTVFGMAILALPAGGYGAMSAFAAPEGPCFSSGAATYRILPKNAAADYRIRIAEAGTQADVTMNIAQGPDSADFVMLDESDRGNSCANSGDVATIALGAKDAADLTIALTDDADADYKIFVRSDNFSQREAAALFAVMLRHNRN